MATEDLGTVVDGDLVAAIVRRDELALAEAVRRHRGSVFAFARRLVGDEARAEDVAQEVFLRLWEQASRFDSGRGTLRGFLMAITHGHALDVVRSDSTRKAREKRVALGTTTVWMGVEAEVVAHTVASSLRDALSRLPESERRAVELAYFGGHSYRLVARMLGEPEGTVKSRIRSGLGRLRVSLATQDLQGA